LKVTERSIAEKIPADFVICDRRALAAYHECGREIRRQSLSSPAVTSAVTLDLVQQLGTERLEEMPDHTVLREELTFELTGQTRRRCSSDDRQR
jgi:hypothetical protein